MKFLVYIVLISLLSLLPQYVDACSVAWYSPGGYYMYRVYEEAGRQVPDAERDLLQNCLAWQQITSPDIPIEAIREIVYLMPLEEFEQLYALDKYKGTNAFASYLKEHDPETLDFLLLAKTNEYIRRQRNSRWYYPSMKTGCCSTLEEIAEQAIAYDGVRLKDRYLLQAVRALFTLGRYGQCVDLWNTQGANLSDGNLMKRMLLPYIAGANYRLNHKCKAIAYFAQAGDIESMLYCAERSGEHLSTVEALEFVYRYAPDCPEFSRILQRFVRKYEPDGCCYGDEAELTEECRRLYRFALHVGHENKVHNRAMWYYTAAFIAELDGRTDEASYILSLAEKSRGTRFIKESVAVFRIYLDCKLYVFSDTYEERLFEQLLWGEDRIVAGLTQEVAQQTAAGYKLISGISYYYWNDMLRRILLSEVCPRMLQAGKTTRALQLANMADNRLRELVGRRGHYETRWNDKKQCIEVTFSDLGTLEHYRRNNEYGNEEYSNHFFELIDSIGLANTLAYYRRVAAPRTEFDRFLNARGYVHKDYLNDIAGTQCLRAMRYEDAVRYLGAVSRSFEGHLNTSLKWDPFALEQTAIADCSDFKYRFADQMQALERSIGITTDPDRKAFFMLRFAIGLRNSFGFCWMLTQYYKGEYYWGQVVEKRKWEYEILAQNAFNRSAQMITSACAMMTNHELAAQTLLEYRNYKTIVEHYPETEVAKFVRGACDTYIDYHLEKIKNYGQ